MRVAELRRERRERDAEGARAAILRAAEEAFTRDGFSGARVDDIALAAGYNKALIFHYFDGKLGLYRALVARIKQENATRITDLMLRYLNELNRNTGVEDNRTVQRDSKAIAWE